MSDNILTYVVNDENEGSRFDKFLGQTCDNLSRSRIQKLIAEGHVYLNNTAMRTASHKVSAGDSIEIHVPALESAEPQPENIPLDIVYEDDDMLVINKPVGMVVHPGAGNWTGTMVNALLHHCADSLSGIGGVIRPGIVHRLDKDTSGLIIVAKHDKAHQHLSDQLAQRTLKRTYHALVIGIPIPPKGTIDKPIGRDHRNRLKMNITLSGGRDAKTHYKTLETFKDTFSLIECNLETGRTHQIRVHMQSIGHPIIGDPLYGPQKTLLKSKLKKTNYNADIQEKILEFSCQFLHAHKIKFEHPRSHDDMEFIQPLPIESAKTLNLL